MNKWQCSSGCLLLLPHCQLPIHHSLTLCVCECVCLDWRRKRRRRRIRREEEERTSEATVQVTHPSFCKTKLQRQRKGREEMFSQNDSLLPFPFPQVINEAKWGCVVSTAQPGIPPFDSPSSANNHPLFSTTGVADRGGRDGHREREAGETRQDRAFSLEIITFTLLMYGQTTKDIEEESDCFSSMQ